MQAHAGAFLGPGSGGETAAKIDFPVIPITK
jgi:hypothetical protein